MAWDTERTERLLALHQEGKTAGEIGAELGTTRNAVIGKLHRLGMARKKLASAPQESQQIPTQASQEPADTAPMAESGDELTGESSIDIIEASEDTDQNSIEAHRRTAKNVEEKSLKLPLMELTSRTCKWPIGDPATDEFWFCGLPSQPGKPYCAAHNNLACQPITSRRDRKLARKPQMRPLRG